MGTCPLSNHQVSWTKLWHLALRQATPKAFMNGSRGEDSIQWQSFTYELRSSNKFEFKYTFSLSGICFLTCLGVFPLLSSSILFSMAITTPSSAVFLDQKRWTAPGLPGNRRNIREWVGLSSTSEYEATPFKKGKRFNQRCRGRWTGALKQATLAFVHKSPKLL